MPSAARTGTRRSRTTRLSPARARHACTRAPRSSALCGLSAIAVTPTVARGSTELSMWNTTPRPRWWSKQRPSRAALEVFGRDIVPWLPPTTRWPKHGRESDLLICSSDLAAARAGRSVLPPASSPTSWPLDPGFGSAMWQRAPATGRRTPDDELQHPSSQSDLLVFGVDARDASGPSTFRPRGPAIGSRPARVARRSGRFARRLTPSRFRPRGL
jgi:hypothetical protein